MCDRQVVALQLEAALDDRVSELPAEASDAGYSATEAMRALEAAVQNQAVIAGRESDLVDADPEITSDSILF